MKYKVLFFFFLLFILFYLYIANLNQESVKLYVGYGKSYETSVANYVVLSFVFGIIVSIIVSFFYDIKRAVKSWNSDRKSKRGAEFSTLLDKAKFYDLRGDRDKSIDVLNRIIKKAPDVEEAYLLLADLYMSMKEYDNALETLALAEANIGKSEPILLKKAYIYRASKKTQQIESTLKEVLKINESSIEALTILRDYFVRTKHWDQAYETEKRLMKFIKTQEEEKRLVGIQYEKVRAVYDAGGDLPDALIKELKNILSEDKRFVPAYILLGEIYKKTDKLNEAGRTYGRGYSKTGHIIFLLKMEDLYIDRGDPGVILKIYRRILDVAPKNYLVTFLYARLCLRLEMIDEALDMLNMLIAEGQEFKGLHRAMAEAFIHHGETEKAVDEFRKAFPMEQIYIPFRCDQCQSLKEEWDDYCESCYSWNTVNVQKEGLFQEESSELKMLYEREDWAREEN